MEDRLGLLTNFYITLMQAEVDRYQDTVRLLKDYYIGMEGISLIFVLHKLMQRETTSKSPLSHLANEVEYLLWSHCINDLCHITHMHSF